MEQTMRYVEAVHPHPHPLLLELEQRSRKDGVALVARETGRLLSTVTSAMQASRILEIGTGYGYATLWMALAQPRMGKIWTIDPDTRRTAVAMSYFKRAEEDDYIEIFNTPSLELLENFPHRNLDIAFIDAEIERYDEYLDLVLPMLKLSGLAIFNGTLLGGRVADEDDEQADSIAARSFNEIFLEHPDLDATLLPVGDGIAIGARKQ
jgi:predicted O-methyltransferase YrrM